MAFSFLKKKKEPRMDLPPPPPAQQLEFPEMPKDEEIPSVKGAEVQGLAEQPIEAPPIPEEVEVPQPIKEMPIPEPEEEIVAPPLPAEIPEKEELIAEMPQAPEHIVPVRGAERKGEVVFDKTISEEKPSLEPGRPLFVSMQDYAEILEGISITKQSLEDAEGIVVQLNDLKNAQEKIFEDWKNQLEDVERKLTYMDQLIVRGE